MTPGRRPPRVLDLLLGWPGFVSALVLLGAAVSLSPAFVETGPQLCPVQRVAGVDCPGCGLSRSFVALGHGSLRRGFGFHPFGPALFGALLLSLGWRVGLSERARVSLRPPVEQIWRRVAPLTCLLWLGWWVLSLVV